MLQDGARRLGIEEGLRPKGEATLAVQPALEGASLEAGPDSQTHRRIGRREALVPQEHRDVRAEDEKRGVRHQLRKVAHEHANLPLAAILLQRLADHDVPHPPGAGDLGHLECRLLPVRARLQGAQRHGVHATQGQRQARERRSEVDGHRAPAIRERHIRFAPLPGQIHLGGLALLVVIVDAQCEPGVVRPVLEVPRRAICRACRLAVVDGVALSPLGPKASKRPPRPRGLSTS
mmetsp:Transcript_22081/g.65828  ORF Transcript_22081/g.65828 Transcript_22081/m.65828 type:complete len:234 (+) Transcript_22081:571-1272(+)